MSTSRLEAFSDGVIAILITIMVLELRVPEGPHLSDLTAERPVLLAYLLSFVNLGIYWNNHHHLLHLLRQISGGVLWANLHLLFWLSLFPFTTAWLGRYHTSPVPVASYGVVALLAAVAYFVLQGRILRLEGPESALSRAVGRDVKGKVSPVLYGLGVVLAFVEPWLSLGLYVVVALIWLVPDRRVERALPGPPAESSDA